MGRYEQKARHHAEQIQYYFEHADGLGYSQAKYHYNQLSNLIGRALKSKNDKSDVVTIQCLRESADSLMQQMKQREVDLMKEQEEQENNNGRR